MEISCGKWSLQIFNNQTNIISVYLVHIIKLLPKDEYNHWIAYNILINPLHCLITPNELDTTSTSRPHSPERDDHIFKNKLVEYYGMSQKGTLILKTLSKTDKPYWNLLSVITEDSPWHFDVQILCISRLLIESINTDVLKERGIKDERLEDDCKQCQSKKLVKIRTINMLKEYLTKYLGNNQQIEESIDFLKKIYSLRILAAHKRSSTKIDKDQKALENKYGKKFPDILNGIFIEINKLISLILQAENKFLNLNENIK